MNVRCIIILLLVVLPCVSCSDGRKSVHPAHGKVEYQNKAAEGMLLVFTPVNDAVNNWPHGFPRATTDKDGTFKVSTYDDGDGIPVGDYVVTITWPQTDGTHESVPTDKLGGRHGDPKTSTWKVTIVPGVNELPAFRLN